MVVSRVDEMGVCFNNKYAWPFLVLAGKDFTSTRSIARVFFIVLTGILKQSILNAEFMEAGAISLRENTRSVIAYDSSLCLRWTYLGL